MGMLRSFTVTFDDGSTLSTNMNGKITDAEIRAHYVGQPFTDEDHNGKETTRRGVSVQIHPDTITCPSCGMPQPDNATTADRRCYLKHCRKPLDQNTR